MVVLMALRAPVVIVAMVTALPAVRADPGCALRRQGRDLVPVLKETGLLLLVYGVALGITLALS